VLTRRQGPSWLGLAADLCDPAAVQAALRRTVLAFGGIDMLVLNAGRFGPSEPVASLAAEDWRAVMSLNLDANFALLQAAHPFLRSAPRGGRIAVVGSKNVHAPGPGAAAYSASKAALQQLARVAALEWGADGIRVNTVHPDAVFDTGLWTPELLTRRAARYGLDVAAYRRRNLLRTEVSARDVGELVAELCGPLFAKTTGAQIPIDGGSERNI